MFLKKLLYPFEFIYIVFFKLVCWYKKKNTHQNSFPFKIVSVGNLTVGGTGKSVVIPFLVRILGEEKSAIVLRGYRGEVEKTNQSVMISDNKQIFVSAQAAGDEALMYAQQLAVPVVVGKDRAQSCVLLAQWASHHQKNIQYVFLDDAYQNFSVKKDCEILLLDARAPFDNGHCLPLGRLREKDYTRADVIIVTHAEALDEAAKQAFKKQLPASNPDHIFFGKHAPGGIFYHNKEMVDQHVLVAKRFLVVAGVGSFSGVLATVRSAGACIGATKEFVDHYSYTQHDVQALFQLMHDQQCNGLLTTTKDWVKLQPLLKDMPAAPIYVLRVAFEFLSQPEYDGLIAAMKKKLLDRSC